MDENEDERGHRVLNHNLYIQLSGLQKKFYLEIRDLASRTFTRNGELLEGHYDYLKSDIKKYKPLEPK